MSKIGATVEIDSVLWQRLEAVANRSGRTRDELIEDSVRRALAGRVIAGIFAQAAATSDLDEFQADALAYGELDAARAARRADPAQRSVAYGDR